MKIIDTHCDTITCIAEQKKSLFKNDLHINIEGMKKYESYCQFFAVFSDPTYNSSILERTIEIIDTFYMQVMENSQDIAVCTSYSEYKRTQEMGKISAFLSIEGAEAIKSTEILRTFYRLGVRLIGLTWNGTNHIASGVGDTNAKYGLTEFGKKIVKEMNKLGIIIDVSHLSDKAFWDVLQYSNKPFIASHSNSRKICGHKRNLTDEQFKSIISIDGCVGINFYPDFLSDNKIANISDIIYHIEHFMSLGGENNIGIGSDFDGVDRLPNGIDEISDVDKIFNELAKIGYKDELIKKIAYGNFERIVRKVL